MSSYGELIQCLAVLKNVKEKRHGIKTLSSLCANRQFQVRIVQRGGWKNAILPLIISLDEECRKYAALAIANLSYTPATHKDLLEEEVLKHLVPILYSEECPEVVIYVLNALGNFASSELMWKEMQDMKTIDAVVNVLQHTAREETRLNCLFCMANMTEDPFQRAWMMENAAYELVWSLLQHLSYTMREYALATLRGLSAETSAQEIFPQMGILPILIGFFETNQPINLRILAIDIMHHLSFLQVNAGDLMQPHVVHILKEVSKEGQHPELVQAAISTIANLCEAADLHDAIVESPLFEVLNAHIQDEVIQVRQHIIRAMMHLSLSPRYHHVILNTGIVASACPIAMLERLPPEVRANSLQMMGAVCATHPTTPTEADIVDLLHLVCSVHEQMAVRRAAAFVLGNCSSDRQMKEKLLLKPYLEVLVLAMSKTTDVVLMDYLMLFFHNICKLDPKSGALLAQSGYHRHMFTYERLESLSATSAIYVADTCREIASDPVVRNFLMEEQIFMTMMDAWVVHIRDPKVAPHLALMCSAFAYHTDCHQEFVLQGGVRLVKQLYTDSPIEHVRLCCILSLLYLAESEHAQRSIAQERGLQMLIHACENETHVDLITNSLKALIPFACSDDFRPQLGMDGALDSVASFMFSTELSLQQLGVFLLQNLLELRANRRIFLGLSQERKCEEDYLEPLVKFLPLVTRGKPLRGGGRDKHAKKRKGDKEDEVTLSPHDPFIVRSAIHCLALCSLEHDDSVHRRFLEVELPASLYDLFYSGHIDRSSGEAIVLFFANALHGSPEAQKMIMKGIDAIAMLLCCDEMRFQSHTNVRCLSALLCIARRADYRRQILANVELIMSSVNTNLNVEDRNEDFYSCCALHCALLCELAKAPPDTHSILVNVGFIEVFLVFITIAGRGLRDEICVELLIGSVLGVSTLLASPTCSTTFMRNLLYPVSRLQLLMSLLRLPPQDIDDTFHAGTFGLRTLQRTIHPGVQPNELHIDHLDPPYFLELCEVKPSNFIYRHVLRSLVLLLADPETRLRVLEGISTRNIVPTCSFALQGSSDIYVQVFGYLLCSSFCCEPSIMPAFVGNPTIMNEIISCVYRASSVSESMAVAAREDRMTDQLAKLAKGGATAWKPKEVLLKRLMLSMFALANCAEVIKEKYRVFANQGPAGSEEDPEVLADGAKGLNISCSVFMKRLSGICLREIDTAELLTSPRLTEVQEYLSTLRLIIFHNSTLARITLENRTKGGLVSYYDEAEELRRRPTQADRILPDLRSEFKRLRDVQEKTDGLLSLVERFIELSVSKSLLLGIMESLAGMTFLSPLSVSTPYRVYQIVMQCPDWLQPRLCLLLANSVADNIFCEVDEWKDEELMLSSRSDHLFPLIATSSLESRNYILAFLANLSAQKVFYEFVKNSGVFRILRPLPSRGYFAEHFSILLEAVRMLANLSCSRPDIHLEMATEHVIGFLRDILRHVCALLSSGVVSAPEKETRVKPAYSRVDVEFDENDMPPLGIKVRWEQPPQIIAVLPDTPAARLLEGLQEGDELMEVNGVDVSEMEHVDIAPMLETRPLHLYFRRAVAQSLDTTKKKDAVIEKDLKVEEIKDSQFYGSREDFVQCFHLGLIALHNLAITTATHDKLLEEPKILNLLIELISQEVVQPSMRRLIFSTLTCLAQRREIAGRIFYQMSDYFMGCEHADSALQKYITLCSNLYYTSLAADEIKPDRSMLIFVGRLSEMQSQEEAATALVEILHGMSRAPRELRKPFIARETMVLTAKFIEDPCYDVQVRAFEAAYFMTYCTCDPNLWGSCEILGRMVKAAGACLHRLKMTGENLDKADALFELTMRVVDLCLEFEMLATTFVNLPDLDRYLMDLLLLPNKPPHLVHCATHLMAGLLKLPIGSQCWSRWKSLGVVDRVLQWFRDYRDVLSGKRVIEATADRSGGNRDFDQMLNMLLFAVENDTSLISSLVGDDVVSCVGMRILAVVQYYRDLSSDPDIEYEVGELNRANCTFRTMAQLMSALSANADGLEAMSKMDLEAPLVDLLNFPEADFTKPALLILCTLSIDKVTCGKLFLMENFMNGFLGNVVVRLQDLGSPYPADELEYVTCILDRGCCHSEFAALNPRYLLSVLCTILSKATTADCQLMALRAITQVGFQTPSVLEDLPAVGNAALHFMMAACYCLQTEGPNSNSLIQRQQMRNKFLEMQLKAPAKARQAQHFARSILAEAISVSRQVCGFVFKDLDGFGMLDYVHEAFEEGYERIQDEVVEKRELICAELLAKMTVMFQVLLGSIFRQGGPGTKDPLFETEGPAGKDSETAKKMTTLLQHVFTSTYGLLELERPDFDVVRRKRDRVAQCLVDDIRTLYFMTALLHEVCAKAVRSSMLQVVRSKAFYNLLEGAIRIARRRYKQVLHGPPPRDLFVGGKQGYGQFESPMLGLREEYSLGVVFEYLLVCLRHLIVQSMVEKTPEVDARDEPWVWDAQETLRVHTEALEWIPEAVKRYGQTNPGLKMEISRYLACAASFYEAPAAPLSRRGMGRGRKLANPDIPIQALERPDGGDEVSSAAGVGRPPSAADTMIARTLSSTSSTLPLSAGASTVLRKFAILFSPAKPEVREFLVAFLEGEDPCQRCLAVLTVANFMEYERQQNEVDKVPPNDVNVDWMCEMLPSMVKALRNAHLAPRETSIETLANGLRFLVTCLHSGSARLAAEVFTQENWEAASGTLKPFFDDEYKVSDLQEYVAILREFNTFVRNWICRASLLEREIKEQVALRVIRPKTDTLHAEVGEALRLRRLEDKIIQSQDRGLKSLNEALEVTKLLNFIAAVVLKLTATRRIKELGNLEDQEVLKDEVFDNALMSYQTLFKRQEESKQWAVNWKGMEAETFDALLETIHRHRHKRSGLLDDEVVINTLYMMTKLSYPYTKQYFPDYLMHVAYGKREGHSVLQDIAAICCAIIFTQNGKRDGRAPTINLGDVVKDYKDFVQSLSQVPDPKLQLWHFRTLTGWSMKPKVQDDVTRDPASLKFVVNALLQQYLDRYAVVFVHNISCLRAQALLQAKGTVAIVCEAYRSLPPKVDEHGKVVSQGDVDNAQRRMLRRLLLAIIRNCTYQVQDLDADLHDDDLKAFVFLVEDLENRDVPLYFAALRNICKSLRQERVAAIVASYSPLMKLLTRHLLQAAKNTNPGSSLPVGDATDLYDLFTQEGAAQEEEEEVEESDEDDDPPTSPSGGTTSQQMTSTSQSPNGTSSRRMERMPTRRKGRKQGQKEDKGLGKMPSLYQKARRYDAQRAQQALSAPPPEAAGPDANAAKKVMTKEEKRQANDRHIAEIEYIYCSVIEIMTHTTFKENSEAIALAVDEAVTETKLVDWLGVFKSQTERFAMDTMDLDDKYVHLTAKFIWHGWANEMFRKHFDTTPMLEVLADLIPFFMNWPNKDVHRLIHMVCIYARLHRYIAVCQYFVKAFQKFPELASDVLSSALVDEDVIIRPTQAASFVEVFVELYRRRCLTQTSLRRTVLGLATSVLTDHPKGFAAFLVQSLHELLSDLFEQLLAYSETGFVKQCIVILMVQTVGHHYKAIPELDFFALRVLDQAPTLLEGEFELFLPVLHRLCFYGGKRVQEPFMHRKLHHRIARILESQVSLMEMERKKAAAIAAGHIFDEDEQPKKKGPAYLEPRQKVQWCLALLTVLGSNEMEQREAAEIAAYSEQAAGVPVVEPANDHAKSYDFDTFVCVDLLPILLRILRAGPKSYEACACLFLMSAVCESPCLAPHMPEVLRLGERAFLPRIEHPSAISDFPEPAEGKWIPLMLPSVDRISIGMKRTFFHLLGRAGFLPAASPALLKSTVCFTFLKRQKADGKLFEDSMAVVHCKLYALAHMCTNAANHKELIDICRLLDVLHEAEAELTEEATKMPRDLRIVWLHSIISLAKLSGPAVMANQLGMRLFEDAFDIAENVLLDTTRKSAAVDGLGLAIQCQQALGMSMCPLSLQSAFELSARAKYTGYLLCLICSGQLTSLRISACDQLVELVGKGQHADVCGAVFMSTTCSEAFQSIVSGADEAFAVAICKVMMAFVECGGFVCHMHMMKNLPMILAMLGDPSSSGTRIAWLAELFVTMTQKPRVEVLDALMDEKGIAAFLSLGRSTNSNRRDLVSRWLEGYGSSLYEIDEVSEVFQISSMRGFLFLGARTALDPEKAQDLRRILFALVYRRISEWRKSAFGVSDFLQEDLINALVPMCELQPDLVAANVAMWHELCSKGELGVLDRVWSGGHQQWLLRRLMHKSGAQMAGHRSSGLATVPLGAPWERHSDLVCMQGMALRLLLNMYHSHPAEFTDRAVRRENLTKAWKEFVTFYFHLPWPMRGDQEVEANTEATIILALQVASIVVHDVTEEHLVKLVQQGLLAVSFAVMLPNPQDQQMHIEEMRQRKGKLDSPDDLLDPEVALVPEAKMIAGSITARLMTVSESLRWMTDRRVTSTCIAMFAQLYHWREHLFHHQGSFPIMITLTWMERQATLYMMLVWVLNLDWCLDHLGLGTMAGVSELLLEIWARHSNRMLRHYCMRTVVSWLQVRPIYAFVLEDEVKAEVLYAAVDQTFSSWDVRALRQIIRLLCACLAFALQINVLPKSSDIVLTRCLAKKESFFLNEMLTAGGASRADYAAARRLLLPSLMADIFTWAEHPQGDTQQPGDTYSRVWILWLAVTLLANEGKNEKAVHTEGEGEILCFPPEVNRAHAERRKFLVEQKVSVGLANPDDIILAVTGPPQIPACNVKWLKDDRRLTGLLAQVAGTSIKCHWKESQQLGCMAASRFFFDLPHFLTIGAFTVDARALMICLNLPDRVINLCALTLVANLSSYQVPLKAQTIGEEFLQRFHELQQQLIEGVARLGEGPYDTMARWLHIPSGSFQGQEIFRCVITFLIGQCVMPPRAEAPSLRRPAVAVPEGEGDNRAPPVAVCGTPPRALLDTLAAEVRQEDLRLRRDLVQEEHYTKGPLFSTLLCHLLYAIAVIVPVHAQYAARSPALRGAAFSQLMKVQMVTALQTPSRHLYDPKDGARQKLFLFLRATACVRSALQLIASGWLAAPAGATTNSIGTDFSLQDEGAKDFVQFCAKHLNQVYTSKTALTRVSGSPWERMMILQGPTQIIAQLLLKACSTDANLRDIDRLGGAKALHSLSRYAESSQIRQEATLLMTKLAVMSA